MGPRPRCCTRRPGAATTGPRGEQESGRFILRGFLAHNLADFRIKTTTYTKGCPEIDLLHKQIFGYIYLRLKALYCMNLLMYLFFSSVLFSFSHYFKTFCLSYYYFILLSMRYSCYTIKLPNTGAVIVLFSFSL